MDVYSSMVVSENEDVPLKIVVDDIIRQAHSGAKSCDYDEEELLDEFIRQAKEMKE